MIPLSVLDLVPVREGSGPAEALAEAALLAKAAEAAGYKRFWVAEHHAMEGIAGGATSVVLAHIGNATARIRIGSGGIMLPNHNPFVIAEQFGTLDALFPGRVDLGLGRAPGADMRISQALRRDLARVSEQFPQDVLELRALLTGEPDIGIRATPGLGARVEMWMLGSSLFGAQLAAALGLPFAFASHFAPDLLDQALEVYRRQFRPTPALEHPHVMVAMNVIAADSDEEAALLCTSMDQSFVALRTGNPGRLKPPVQGYRQTLPPTALAMLEHMRQVSAIGSPATVADAVARVVERTGADELIVSGSTFDPAARRHSLDLTMKALA
ncbi:luciferase family oxidoreductase group 1 [Novosphingobium kunmingense]|uniref:Luciferase-like monooxygenase n=1 Tax=Novosphingobium kunmingense TaxID=1211806 RepID=A0A2N0H5G2_9SPHN|nr:LLM class flavin-dependent oxidoreductase [Novosphingobium kunmingense]PKB14178.1 luciferase family oxidoreductase group 1 [Novosphingobium kunmingense]